VNALLALDPLLISGHLGWREILIIAIKVLVVFTVALVATILVIWFERKAIAGLQNRIGPNKAGPYGTLQTLADGLKLILK
jgi:NADH-quinone oxidoreductase subunit H